MAGVCLGEAAKCVRRSAIGECRRRFIHQYTYSRRSVDTSREGNENAGSVGFRRSGATYSVCIEFL